MVLGYSRAVYVEFTNRCNVHTFIRCLIRGFEYFGGVTDIVLTDRMKTVILGTDENKRPIWNPIFEDLAVTLGLVPKVCRARRPQTKRKVESGIDFVKNNFLPGRKFADYGDLNRQAIVWCEKKTRIYGVPWQYSGKEVVVRDKNGKIEILYDGKVIATQEKHYRSRTTVFLKDQYKGLKEVERMLYPRPRAIKLSFLEVEKCSLEVY